MDIRINPQKLFGAVTPPPSKSMSHRAMLAQMLCEKPGVIMNLGDSQDIQATGRCLEALRGSTGEALPLLDCGESGSTLRFLIPVALAVKKGARFTGQGRLMERPQKPYFDIFEEKGIQYSLKENVLTVQGELRAGVYSLPGNVSSQFITGLLYALPMLEGDSEIRMTSKLESTGYVDMTLDTLQQFGIHVENRMYKTFFIPGRQKYQGRNVTVETDWSQAAFWYAAAFLNNPVKINGLREDSLQGDRVIAQLYHSMKNLGELEVDVSECPDLLPALAVMAAVRSGQTCFVNAARLRVKESDRLSTTAALLHSLGVAAQEQPETLIVDGGSPLSGGIVDGANDHRIVMAAAVAATVCTTPVTILGAEAINKSYPRFWEDYKALGGDVCVL